MRKEIEKNGPYIRTSNSTSKMMTNLMIALLPIIVFTTYKNGFLPYISNKITLFEMFYPLIFLLVPTIITFIVETLYAIIFLKKRKRDILKYIVSSYSFFPGLFLGLILPIHTPLWVVSIGAVIASLSKMLFGGLGKNWFNPALIGYLVLFIFFSNYFQVDGGYFNALELDTISSPTPLTNVSLVEGIGTYNSLVAPYGSLWNFFLGTIPGAVGETSALLCLIAFIYLTITKTIKWKIPVVYIFTVFFSTFLIGNINNLGIWYPLFQILSGGLMFGAVFMATDPVTSPVTSQAQILYGLFLGILTVAVRYLTPIPEGVFISILIMNLFVRILDKIGAKAKFDFRVSILPYLIAWIFIIGLGFYVGNTYAKEASKVDSAFEILSRETIGNKTTYIATQKGYVSSIKAEVIINNEKVISYKILEQKESYYHLVDSAKYLDTLINYQFNLNDVDTVSGATVTSTALKKLLQNVLNDYQNADIPIVDTPEEKDFEVLNYEILPNSIVYTVSKKSFGGMLKLRITYEHDIVKEITVLEQNDSYFGLIIDADYITTLIQNQQVLDNIDTVSGATISSTALKEAVILTTEKYQELMEELRSQIRED